MLQEDDVNRRNKALNKREQELTSIHASRQRELEEAQRIASVAQRKAADDAAEARANLKREKNNVQRRLSELQEQTTAVAFREKALAESELMVRKEMAQKAEREQKLLRRETVSAFRLRALVMLVTPKSYF